MGELLKQMADPAWWISVVVMGLLINLASDYLKPAIDKLVGEFSNARKQANERQEILFKEDVQNLLNNPSRVIELRLDILYFNIRAVLHLIILLSITINVSSIPFPFGIIVILYPFINFLANINHEKYHNKVLKEYENQRS